MTAMKIAATLLAGSCAVGYGMASTRPAGGGPDRKPVTVAEVASRGETGGWEYNCTREDRPTESIFTWNPAKMADWVGFGISFNRGETGLDLSRLEPDQTFLSLEVTSDHPEAIATVQLSTSIRDSNYSAPLAPRYFDRASGRYLIPLSAFTPDGGKPRWDRVTGLRFSTWKLTGINELAVRIKYPVRIVTMGAYDPLAGLHARLGARQVVQTVTAASAAGMLPGADVSATLVDGVVRAQWNKTGLWSGLRGPQLFLPFDLGGKASVDLGKQYAMTFAAVKIRVMKKEDLECIRLGFWDEYNQNSRNEARIDPVLYDPAAETWFVPMAGAFAARLDKVRGITLAVHGNQAPVSLDVVLPITLLDNGRRDDRPLSYDRLPEIVAVAVDAGRVTKDLANFGYGGHRSKETPDSFLASMGMNMSRISLSQADPADQVAQRREANDDKWGGHDEQRPTWRQDIDRYARQGNQWLSIIMPYNEYYKLPADGRPPLEKWIGGMPKAAGYLAGKNAFPVRYYELGNEIWNDMKQLGGGSAVEGSVIPADIDLYTGRIRAMDPGAKFMASFAGYGSVWPYLMKRLDKLDVLNFSWYGWKDTYEGFRDAEEGSLDWLAGHLEAIRASSPAAADRIMFAATEYAPHDWAGDWPNVDDLGHALWAFDKAAEAVAHPRMAFIVYWPYLWYWWHDDQNRYAEWNKKGGLYTPYNDYPEQDWNLVTKEGRPTAVGKAVRIMGLHRLDLVLACTSSLRPHVTAYATRKKDGSQVNLFILNKDFEGKRIKLDLKGFAPTRTEKWVFTGEGLRDPEPELRQVENDLKRDGGEGWFTAPELAVTMIKMFRDKN